MSPKQAEYKSIVGVDEVYYALLQQDDADGYVALTPQKLVPAMTIKGTPATTSETQYADNQAFDQASAEGVTELELTAPSFPDTVIAELLGEVFDAVSGRIFDNADPAQSPYFAIGYRFKKSNGKYRYRWYLKCRAEKPGEEADSQTDKVTFKTQTLKVSALKTIHKFDLLGDRTLMDGVKRVRGDEDTENFDGASWFSAVQVPVAGAPAAFTLTSSPLDGATDVALFDSTVLTFSNPLASGREAGIALVNANSLVPVAVARIINATRNEVTLTPIAYLNADTSYAIVIHDVVDIYGQALADTVIDFTTPV